MSTIETETVYTCGECGLTGDADAIGEHAVEAHGPPYDYIEPQLPTTETTREKGRTYPELKDELLFIAEEKPVRRFLQIDGFCNLEGGDDVMVADADDDTMCSGVVDELRNGGSVGDPVRILIHEDADPEDVRRLLTKMAAYANEKVNGPDWWERYTASLAFNPPSRRVSS
jgi:hypothetical protein